MDLARHVALFTEFADRHFSGETGNDYHIRLKLDHSLRVLDNARTIIAEEGITGRTADLATLAALYHDIGRFPQFARYATFKDADSINHGRMGVLTLRALDLPETVPPGDWRLIRAAVGLHNVKQVNRATPPLLRTMVDITRDADKLDIYAVILDHLDRDPESRKVVIHSLEEHPTRYSPEVYRTVLSGAMCEYGILRYSNDFILLLIGWLFMLEYDTSIRLLHQRGLVARPFSLLPKTPEIRELEANADAFIRYKEKRTS